MKRVIIPIIITFCISIILFVHASYFRFVCDDAFISFRYAKNLVEGHGLVYNIGERVEGYTNFLWTLFLSAFMGLGLDVVMVSQVLGILFSLSTVLLLLYFNRKLYPTGSLFNYLAPLFLGSCGAYAAWSTGGLETSFYTFLVFLGSFLFITGMNHPRYLTFSGITFALVCMTRLDGLIFAGITFIWLFYLAVIRKRIEFKFLVLWTLCFLVPFLAYFFWRWSYYGRLLPNTYYVKVGGLTLYHQGLYYLFESIRRFRLWLLIVPLAFLGKVVKSNIKLKIIIPYFVSLISVFSLYIVYIGGDFMDMFRFLVPVLPMLFFLVQEGFRGMYYYSQSIMDHPNSINRKHSTKSQQSGIKNKKAILIAMETGLIILIVIFLVYPSKESNRAWNRKGIDSIGLLKEYTRLWSKVGMMFKEIAKPGESMSIGAAGAIPYYSGLYTIDELCLTLKSYPELKFIKVRRAGHQMMITNDFLATLKPTYIVGHPQLYDRYEQPEVLDAGIKLAQVGYKLAVIPIKMSENETKYFYCVTLRKFDSENN